MPLCQSLQTCGDVWMQLLNESWQAMTREFTSVNIYVRFFLHLIVIFQSECKYVSTQFSGFRIQRGCVQHVASVYAGIFFFPLSFFRISLSSPEDNIVCRQEADISHCYMNENGAAISPVSFSLPAILFVQQLRPPVNAAAGLASFLALLLLISARHRDRQKERAFSGRS